MRVLFPSDPARPGRVAPAFVEASAAAAAQGIASGVVDLAALVAGDAEAAVARVRISAGEPAEWRGAPLDTPTRARLADALRARGLVLADDAR